MLNARRLFSIFLLAALMLANGAVSAHHGRGNRYDMDAVIPIEGTVREVVWRNPHIAIIVDVENENGEVVPWVIEHSNVSTLARLGYHRNSLKPGQPVTVYINPGRDGVPIGLCRRIVLEDGSEIFVRGETVD